MGQLFNATRLGADCGISAVTATQWLSGIKAWSALAHEEAAPGKLVYGGSESFSFQKTQVVGWRDIAATIPE